MQLKKQKKISRALTAATCSLLGINSADSLAEEGDWTFDSAVLFYSEVDRVSAIEPVITAKRDFGEDKALNLKLVFDTLSGASANGATPSDQPQTFTRPSGKGSYTTSAQETPLDDTFRDSRIAISSQWEQPINRDYRTGFGVNFSTEYDYSSISANANLSRDFNKRNTTLNAGLSMAFDTISPEGDIPIGLSSMAVNTGQSDYRSDFNATRGDSEDNKDTLDLIFGLTQVIDRNTIMQMSYSYSDVSGYLTDPFKIISVVGDDGRPVKYRYEQRPDSRSKHSLYWQAKHQFESDIIDLSYRYFWDDWGIASHTIDLRYRWMLGGKQYLEPHIRYYDQSEADFYRRFFIQGESLPDHVSADYRLGDMNALTIGMKYGMALQNEQELSMRLEYYIQSNDNTESVIPGILNDMDLYPDVEAIMLQLSYKF
jgi:opacity protein-like surface antigen